MSKLPVSIIIDDPAPGIHVYYHHVPGHTLEDGQKLFDDMLLHQRDVLPKGWFE